MGPYVYVNAIFVGVFAFSAVYHLVLWWLSRRESLLLVFAAHCALCSILSGILVSLATARTTADYQFALDMRTTVGPLAIASIIWTLTLISGITARWYLWPVTAALISLSLINLFVFSLNGAVMGLGERTLPWGESFSVPQRSPAGWWMTPIYALVLTTVGFSAAAARGLWSRDRVGGGLLALASLGLLGVVVVGVLTDIRHVALPYFGAAPYAAFVVVIAMQIARDYRRQREQVIESEKRYRLIVENQTEFIVRWLPDGTRTFVNDSYCRYFGVRAEDCIGSSFLPLVAPEFQEMIRRKMASVTPDNPQVYDEHISIAAKGERRWQEWVDRGIFDAVGKLVELQSVGRDITRRKLAEEALHESHQLVQAIAEASPQWIHVFDLDKLSVTYSNRPFLRELGYPERQTDIRSLEEFKSLMPEEEHARLQRLVGEWQSIADGLIRENEFRLRHADGTYHWFLGRATVFARHPDGRVRQVLGTLHDITEHKLADAARREVESRHRAILESSLDGLIVMNASGEIVEFNAAAETIFGHSSRDAVGKNLGELIVPERDRQAHRRGLEQYLTTGVGPILGRHVEMSALRAGGAEFRVELTVVPVAGSKPPLFAGVVRDITERLKLEEQVRQSQKMQAIGQLAGGVAHDFNNLLTVINGFSDLLLDTLEADNPARASVVSIRDAGEQAALLTRQLLLFSRKQVIDAKVMDVNSVLQSIGSILQRLIGEDITVTTVAAPDLRRVKTDPGQIEQVIMNLSVNAREAMPSGGRLTLSTANETWDEDYCRLHPDCKPGHYVRLTVADTGCGMKPEVQAHIFEPFFTTKGTGTGLGLAIVYGIVQQSGGVITVQSAVGAGTTINVFLPAVAVEASGRPSDTADASPLHGHETVLLVEDAERVRRIIRLVLDMHGYSVLEAGAGPEAIALAEKHAGPIDLLLTDVVMPQMNGRQLAATLRACRPDLKVLFMSGYNDNVVVNDGTLQATEAFLPKPITPLVLAKKVRQLLDVNRD